MKKKITAFVLCVAMLAIAVAGGTMAYFTDDDSRDNVIVVGNVSAKLYESKYDRGATGSSHLKMTGQPEPLDDATIAADDTTYNTVYLPSATLMPFDMEAENHQVQSMFEECTVAKNAYVQNTSKTNDCFVRVRYIVPENIAQYLDIVYSETQFIAASDAEAIADARLLDNTDKKEPMITNVNTAGGNFAAQGKKDDGKGTYSAEFIYAERLLPGEFTMYSPISKIALLPSVDENTIAYLGLTDRQFTIKVEADIIQADGFLNAVEAFNAFDTP